MFPARHAGHPRVPGVRPRGVSLTAWRRDRPAGKILALHGALDAAGLPHAFGGALALAWCTERARGTIDIDLNVFVAADQAEHVAGARCPTRSRGPTPTAR